MSHRPGDGLRRGLDWQLHICNHVGFIAKGVIVVSVLGRMRDTIDPSYRADKRRRLTGVVLLGVTICGLLYVVWWVLTHEDQPRFRGIEKFRGQVVAKEIVPLVEGQARCLTHFQKASCGCRHSDEQTVWSLSAFSARVHACPRRQSRIPVISTEELLAGGRSYEMGRSHEDSASTMGSEF